MLLLRTNFLPQTPRWALEESDITSLTFHFLNLSFLPRSGLTQAHVKVCAFLLDRGAETEAQTNDASTPLHYFVRMDPEDILEFHKVNNYHLP